MDEKSPGKELITPPQGLTNPPQHFTLGMSLDATLTTKELIAQPTIIADFKPYLRGDDMAFVITQTGGDAISWKLELRDDEDVVIQSWQGKGSQTAYWDGILTHVEPDNPVTDYHVTLWRTPPSSIGSQQPRLIKRVDINNEGYALDEATGFHTADSDSFKVITVNPKVCKFKVFYRKSGYHDAKELVSSGDYTVMAINTNYFDPGANIAGEVLDGTGIITNRSTGLTSVEWPYVLYRTLLGMDRKGKLIVKKGREVLNKEVAPFGSGAWYNDPPGTNTHPFEYTSLSGIHYGFNDYPPPTPPQTFLNRVFKEGDYQWAFTELGDALASETDLKKSKLWFGVGDDTRYRTVIGVRSNLNLLYVAFAVGYTAKEVGSKLHNQYKCDKVVFPDSGNSTKFYAIRKKDKGEPLYWRADYDRKAQAFLKITSSKGDFT